MFKVLQYSLGYTFRKKSTPILLALLFALSLAIPMIAYLANVAKGYGYRYVKAEIFLNGSIGSALIPIFLMLVSYIAVVVGQIFKRGEEDGTTLMLVSSKYTRSEVILGRFAAVVVHVLLTAVIFAAGFSLASAFASPSAAKYEFLSFISVLVGSFFISLLFASLAITFSILMGRIGAIVLSVFTFVFLAVLSPILLMVTSNGSYDLQSLNYVSKEGSDRRVFLYENQNNSKVETQETLYSRPANSNGDSQLQIMANKGYNKYAWIDVWTQLSEMMGMFDQTSPNPTPLDKITPVSIKDSYFYQNDLPYLDDQKKSPTDSNADKKMVFDLVRQYNSLIHNSFDLSTSELHMMQDNFGPLLKLVQGQKFADDVNKFKPIVETINKIKYDGGLNTDVFDALVSMADALDKNNSLLNSINADPSKYELRYQATSSTNWNSTFQFYENGKDVAIDFDTYTSNLTKLHEAFYDLDAAARRMAIYFAAFEVEKAGVTEAAINGTSIASPAPIGDIIKNDNTFKRQFALEEYKTANKIDLYNTYGNSATISPIVPSAFIYVFWPAVALGLFGLAFVLHRRADFK